MTGAKPQSQSHEPHESQKTQSPYAQLFRIPGTKAFCVSGAIARLPMSMMGLGIVLALNHMYDNWTIAGVMSAAYVLATAAVTPLYARLFDRFGQRKVGPVILTVQIIVMLGFAFAALMRVPIPLLFVLAVVMGMTQFSFGALVRTRWAYVLDRADKEDLLNTAYALESAIDEIVFIFGPILAAFLAASVHPVSQLFVPTLACAFGGAVFFALRDTQPPVLSRSSRLMPTMRTCDWRPLVPLRTVLLVPLLPRIVSTSTGSRRTAATATSAMCSPMRACCRSSPCSSCSTWRSPRSTHP